MSSFTPSGARRTGDEYQDLHSAQVLIEWLEQPDEYRWVRLEVVDGALDDIQVERRDGSRRLLQVKFATDANAEWDWDDLTEQLAGARGLRPSLLQKWKQSVDDVVAEGITVNEAALLTNRAASAAIRAHMSDAGIVDYRALSHPLQTTLSGQLGGPEAAEAFLAHFHFFFRATSPEALDDAATERFCRLGGTSDGFTSLMRKIRRWINRNDEPTPDGTIRLEDLRAAALWRLPVQIPQEFVVPLDYVCPEEWSTREVLPQLTASNGQAIVVTGTPGAGKSTYLSWLVAHLHDASVPVVRHHYFLSTKDGTTNRTAWETAADSIIGQLRTLYPTLIYAMAAENPEPGKLRDYLIAAGAARVCAAPLVVVVDGLDHVWRDTHSDDGLMRLFDILLPAPGGVVIVVGTQDVDINHVPRKLREQCPRARWLAVPVLDRASVRRWIGYHSSEFALPVDLEHASWVLEDLADAFQHASGGQPLILHYVLTAALQIGRAIAPDQVRAMRRFDANSDIGAYYRSLWDEISPEGHQLLHLLAGFPWVWPREGLVQCLAPQADSVRLEAAELATRHVLGSSSAGVRAFHESLLVFIRAVPDHSDVVRLLRPRVLDWLAHRAPEYWRWRHEWEERARGGDGTPLIASATLEWSIDSLARGRSRLEVAEIVAASGWAALRAGELGRATECHFLDLYLDEAEHVDGVFPNLLGLALQVRQVADREVELRLFLSHIGRESLAAVAAAAEVAFRQNDSETCIALLNEGIRRWDASVRRASQTRDMFTSLSQTLPFLFAATLETSTDGPYKRHALQHGTEPDWCPSAAYAKALAKCCTLDGGRAVRDELRFLANRSGHVSFDAVDDLVRLSCRDGFAVQPWITDGEAQRSGFFRCCVSWVQQPQSPAFMTPPREVSFAPSSTDYELPDDTEFVEQARAYFFSCAACATEGRARPAFLGLDSRATKVSAFLSCLGDLAGEAVTVANLGVPPGGAWFARRLVNVPRPDFRPNDHHNRRLRPDLVARIVVDIAHDLEDLHFAHAHTPTLDPGSVEAAIESGWTSARSWIDDRVEQRLQFRDAGTAAALIARERTRLTRGRDTLPSRAAEYAALACFSHLHRAPVGEVRELARLAARNLLGHGYHKDLRLFDILAAIRSAQDGTFDRTLTRLRAISPVVQVIDEITDSDHTRYLKAELAQALWVNARQALPSYLRTLQRAEEHWVVQSCFTSFARKMSLDTPYQQALAATIVHEEGLTAFEKRANAGDTLAAAALYQAVVHAGRRAADADPDAPSARTAREPAPVVPRIDDYPPARLNDFLDALRDVNVYGDEYVAAWTEHWRERDPDSLLIALDDYLRLRGHPHETRTARSVVDLATSHLGLTGAWKWLVVYHTALHGWLSYASELRDIQWIWERVRDRFRDRWQEFVTDTSHPSWASAADAPAWSVERLARYLDLLGEGTKAASVVDAAVQWGSGMAADMPLPDHALQVDAVGVPDGLGLLLDRLECPSKMVQERAAWGLASLLAGQTTRDATRSALLRWHDLDVIELRSCVVLLILHLSRAAHGLSTADAVSIAAQVRFVPSIGAALLLREFGTNGVSLAASLNFLSRHSSGPAEEFKTPANFRQVVRTHLAPAFEMWASELGFAAEGFRRQWAWEAVSLARDGSVSLTPHLGHHAEGVGNDPFLPVNDQVAVILRSAYLRALHWSMDQCGLEVAIAENHARRVAVLADPVLWAVQPTSAPEWWPIPPSVPDAIDALADSVGDVLRVRLAHAAADDRVLLYAAGPIGNDSRSRAELEIRAFLQVALGSASPTDADIADAPRLGCEPIPPRLSVSGAYGTSVQFVGLIDDWLISPLSWELQTDSVGWLLPEREQRGVHVPAAWLFAEEPVIATEASAVLVTVAERPTARYRWWANEVRERQNHGADSRVGAELLLDREHVQPHLDAGATLCWIATLSVATCGDYESSFRSAQVVGTWLFGGSRLVRPILWSPPELPHRRPRA